MATETSPVQRQLEAFNAHDLDAFVACYAGDVVIRHGDGRVLVKGHEGMRGFYGSLMNDPALHTEAADRLHSGDWVVDEEHTVWTGGEADRLVAYEVRDGLIQAIVMLGGPV